jgi:hypothetical protein
MMSNAGAQGLATRQLQTLYVRVEQREGGIAIGEIVDSLGRAGLGMTLLVLSLPALIPIPGPFGMVFGTIVAIMSAQLMFGARRLILPRVLRVCELPASAVRTLVQKALPILQRAEAMVRERRLLALTGRWGRMGVGAVAMIMGVAVALPVPTGNFLPVASLVTLSLGLIARDGVVVLLGVMLGAVAVAWFAILFWFGAHIVEWMWQSAVGAMLN